MGFKTNFFERHAILLSKLRCPVVQPNSLLRHQLTAKLDAGYHKSLTVVQAPAGFGKTTAIAHWFLHQQGPKGWLALDELDNDFPKFISYVYALLQQSTKQVQPAPLFQDWSKICSSNAEQIIAFFCDHLRQYQQRPVIVFDDFHWITDKALVNCIERLLKYIDNLANIVLITRSAPPFSLHERLLTNQIQFIYTHDLKFTDTETRHFFAQYDDQSFASFTATLKDISGWPAGLQLYRMARENHLPLSQEQALISDYIFAEIIRLMPEPLLSATLRAAVSRRFNRQLLLWLSPEMNVDSFLDVLEKQYNFVSMTGHEDRWYRFHSLFRHALIDHFRRTDPCGYRETERRCTKWWLQQAYYSEAAEHLILAGDESVIASFLMVHGWSFYRNGQYRLLGSCFKKLPLDTVTENANLTLTYAWWALINEDPMLADTIIKRAEQRLPALSEHCASLYAVKSVIAVIFDDYFAAEHWAEASLAERVSARPWERCHVFLAIAEARLNQCDFQGADAALSAANQICQAEKYTTLLIQVLYLDAEIQSSLGHWQAAQQRLETALKTARERGLSQLFSVDHLQRTYARVLRLQGQTSAAHSVLDSVDVSQHPLGNYWQFPILIEQLLSLMFNDVKPLDTLTRLVKNIVVRLSTSQFSVKWQLSADRALILFWAYVGDEKQLRAVIQRYQTMNFQTPRFTLNAHFNLAMAWLACGEAEASRATLAQCSEGAALVGYAELQQWCQVVEVIICQHQAPVAIPPGVLPPWYSETCAEVLVPVLSNIFNCKPRLFPRRSAAAPLLAKPQLLTKTEQKVQNLLDLELSNKAVAERLGVTVATVRSHIKSINRKRKTPVTSEVELLR